MNFLFIILLILCVIISLTLVYQFEQQYIKHNTHYTGGNSLKTMDKYKSPKTDQQIQQIIKTGNYQDYYCLSQLLFKFARKKFGRGAAAWVHFNVNKPKLDSSIYNKDRKSVV